MYRRGKALRIWTDEIEYAIIKKSKKYRKSINAAYLTDQ